MAVLNISISHDVPGTDIEGVTTKTVTIPPDYDDRDRAALFAYEVEMLAVLHAQQAIGHEEIHKALRAGHARLAAIRLIVDRLTGPERAELEDIFSATNDEAISRWEERRAE